MKYVSTRGSDRAVTSAEAVVQGIAPDGGLYVPESLPAVTMEQLRLLADKSYVQRAAAIFSLFLTDFTPEELEELCKNAYGGPAFDTPAIAPISKLGESGVYMLELWHGPTCAFKDLALQFLPHLLTASAKKTGCDKEIVILVATSGDTGKAALEGFKDVKGTRIIVLYPSEGVSEVQRLQMVSQEGGNLSVCAVKGNFDDTQTAVKEMFTDPALAGRLAENGMVFSSANSINLGRLLPQVVYYFSAYCDLVTGNELDWGEAVNIVVPTGNFGNILAAYYAKGMGLPVNKLICASNANNVLTECIKTGFYSRNRRFFTTISPSMDIIISSNLERLLYSLYGGDDKAVAELMDQLSKNGEYRVAAEVLEALQASFFAGCCNDEPTKETIGDLFENYGYLCDTHTAVGYQVYRQYLERTKDSTKTIIASTASPFKFAESVGGALGLEIGGGFEAIGLLSEATGVPVPEPISRLEGKPARFDRQYGKKDIAAAVEEILGL